MTLEQIHLGTCFHKADAAYKNTHLYTILTPPFQVRNQEAHVVACMETYSKDRKDSVACTLQPGEHPFLKKVSCVCKDGFTLIPVSALYKLKAVEDMPVKSLIKILEAGIDSEAPSKIKQQIQKQWYALVE